MTGRSVRIYRRVAGLRKRLGVDPAAPQPLYAYVGGALSIVFEDTFTGTSLDTSKWNEQESDQRAANGGTGRLEGNWEWYPYPAPTSILEVSNGTLKMRAKRDAAAASKGALASGCAINTRGKFATFTHGIMEVRFKTDLGKSAWPAIWTLGNGGYGNPTPWPETGEWDWWEQENAHNISGVDLSNVIWGRNADTVYAPSGQVVKFDNKRRGSQDTAGGTYQVRPYVGDGQWHVLTIKRTAAAMEKYIDGTLIYRWVPGELASDVYKEGGTGQLEVLPQRLFDDPMHLRLDMQYGGDAAYIVTSSTPGAVQVGTTNTWVLAEESTMEIDYVRVWALPSNSIRTAPAQPAGSALNWPTVLFEDNFTGTGLDTTKWSGNEPWQGAPGYLPEDNAQIWVPVPPHPSTLQVADSVLTLPVTKQTTLLAGQPSDRPWTGQVLTTRGKFSLPANTRCFLEFRVKFASGLGLWQILWLLGNGVGAAGWPVTGENDIIEMVNQGIKDAQGQSDYGHAFGVHHWSTDGTINTHAQAYQVSSLGKRTDLFAGWHIIGYDRRADRIDRYIDGVLDQTWLPNTSYQLQPAPPQVPLFTDAMHIKISSQIGSPQWGLLGLTPDQWQAGAMQIDYVKVWRQ